MPTAPSRPASWRQGSASHSTCGRRDRVASPRSDGTEGDPFAYDRGMKPTASVDGVSLQDATPGNETGSEAAELRRAARAHWAADCPDAALAAAWAAYEAQAEHRNGRALLARLLHGYPRMVGRDREDALVG